jgi:hypothetical protein
LYQQYRTSSLGADENPLAGQPIEYIRPTSAEAGSTTKSQTDSNLLLETEKQEDNDEDESLEFES